MLRAVAASMSRKTAEAGGTEHEWLDYHAHRYQQWPDENETPWTVWLLLGGRGAGKTRAGAEWIRDFVRKRRRARVALVSETYADGREVMIDGNSGLSNIGPERERPHYEASRRRLIWPWGAVGYVFSSEDPDGLRGHQFDAAWSDEVGCPAVDKGANAPNVFVDPKSAESALPPYSSGARDDQMQRRTLEAVHDYWRTHNEANAGVPLIETETGLRFQPRGAASVATLGKEALADDGKASITITTGQKSDAPTAVRLGYIDEGGDYLPAIAEARFPFADDDREISYEIPAAMDEANAASRAASILADAGVMRETAAFSLPPSLAALEPGDAVRVTIGNVARDWRITQMTDGAVRKVEAVRVAPAVYEAPVATGGFKIPASVPQFGKPAFELMNLPLLRDDDDEAAPYLAVYADPWPGAIALYRGAALAATATARAVMGRLETSAPPGVSGRWDARALKVSLNYGTLVSRSEEEVLAGANAAAIETSAGWEIIQFRDANLEPDGAWTLTGLLRGQNGTEEEAAIGAAAGAPFVLLNGAIGQAVLPLDLRGLSFDWSAGPADDPPTEPSFRTKTFAGEAMGAKPYSPAHLMVVETAEGDIALSWKRRTRKGGDSWEGEDVPLNEAYERYRIEIYDGAALIRTAESATPGFVYSATDVAADFPTGRPPLTIRVAQLSDKVGPGKWASAVV